MVPNGLFSLNDSAIPELLTLFSDSNYIICCKKEGDGSNLAVVEFTYS